MMGSMENYKWKSQVEGIAAVGQTSQRNSHAKKVSTPGKKDCKTGNGELKLSLKTATTKNQPPLPPALQNIGWTDRQPRSAVTLLNK